MTDADDCMSMSFKTIAAVAGGMEPPAMGASWENDVERDLTMIRTATVFYLDATE